MKYREERHENYWTVPYLPIDPKDLGREYEGDVIRINSQSGKGGIGYLMEQRFGFNIPKKMREDFGYMVKDVSDHLHKELQPDEIVNIFRENYINIETKIRMIEAHFEQKDGIIAHITLEEDGKTETLTGHGNGRLDAVTNAFGDVLHGKYTIETYEEHAISTGSNSQACAYIGLSDPYGNVTWGVGIHNDIINASIIALISAINRIYKQKGNLD